MAAAARLPAGDLLSIARVLVVTTLVEVAIRTVPLPRVARWLAVPLDTVDARPAAPAAPPSPAFDRYELRRLRAAKRVMARWPFGGGPCLRQSLVVGYLLRSRHPVLRLGVGSVDGTVMAHAWIEVSGTSIGGRDWLLPLFTGPVDHGGEPRHA